MAYMINLQLIKEKRLQHGYTMSDMSEFLGLKNRADYFKRENGDTRFRSVELPILSKKLGIPMAHFFTRQVEKIETN